MNRRKWLFVANRVLLILAVAAILGGLALYQWDVVWGNARIL